MSGKLIGTTQATVQGGIASFNDLEDDTAGTLTLQFAAGTLPPVISDPSTVTPGPASSLAVVVNRPPGGIPVGSKFTVVATAHDNYGNVASSFNSSVALSLGSGSAGTLTGTLTQTATAGVATFPELSDTTSGSITVNAAGGSLDQHPLGQRHRHAQPGHAPPPCSSRRSPSQTATAGQPLATTAQPVVVYEEDQYGNLETGDSITTVTATLSDQAAQLLGTATVTVAGGVATFTDLSTQKAGTMMLVFNSTGLTGVSSKSIVISPAAASQIVIQTQPSTTATAGVAFGTQPVIAEEDTVRQHRDGGQQHAGDGLAGQRHRAAPGDADDGDRGGAASRPSPASMTTWKKRSRSISPAAGSRRDPPATSRSARRRPAS